jgi:hypothetical protein
MESGLGEWGLFLDGQPAGTNGGVERSILAGISVLMPGLAFQYVRKLARCQLEFGLRLLYHTKRHYLSEKMVEVY